MGVKVLQLDPGMHLDDLFIYVRLCFRWFVESHDAPERQDMRIVRMKLPLTTLSRNPGGVLFGGFQACLADPIAGLAAAKRFKTHACWTRHLALDFQRGADSDLELRFEFTKGAC